MAAEVHYGTGRRKRSVARVFIKRGKGKIQVNKKSLDEFFLKNTDRKIISEFIDRINNYNCSWAKRTKKIYRLVSRVRKS